MSAEPVGAAPPRTPPTVLALTAPGRADRSWLELRRDADTAARDRGTCRLALQLAERAWASGARRLVLVDLGAGSGANRRYLAPRLPMQQRWICVDHDPTHLENGHHQGAQTVLARVADVGPVLTGLPREPDDHLVVTCSALLDLLTDQDLVAVADAVTRHDASALLSLSVTGEVSWSPADVDDDLVRDAFEAHQRRDGRLGSSAPDRLVDLLRRRGRQVRSTRTDWVLDEREPALLSRFLDERVDAALEQLPQESDRLICWRERRHRQLAAGGLGVVVGHVDLVVSRPRPDGPRPG